MRYEVVWNDVALDSVAEIRDARVQRKLLDLADDLAEAPRTRGRPLTDDLTGWWSFHWSRWRIIYSIDETARVVSILVVGMRAQGKDADIYRKAQRAVNQRLILLEEEDQ